MHPQRGSLIKNLTPYRGGGGGGVSEGSLPQIHAAGIWALPVRGGVSTLARMVWGTFLEKNLPRSNGHLLD